MDIHALKPLTVKDREILDRFDIADPVNVGRPLYWSLDNHIISIEQMIAADEIQLALKMCDNVPGWYRDNYPLELKQIKDRLYQQMYDQFDYASDADEAGWLIGEIEDQCFSNYTYPRADILAEDIRGLNAEEKVPWIFEISPSHGWLPIGFKKHGLKFHFFGKNLNQKALDKIKAYLGPSLWQPTPGIWQHKIMVCFESLEHMWNPHDLKHAAYKTGITYDSIYLSTPKYTLGCGLPDWKTRRLGHVRTWTPSEFSEFARVAWPDYTWDLWPAHSMVLRGRLKQKKKLE